MKGWFFPVGMAIIWILGFIAGVFMTKLGWV